ncbi:MAG: OmpA family protein, partial [Pyrinomonadaceae bacterium]|nr:OmpA family protein [Pyrinomonadaceae bacterium]
RLAALEAEKQKEQETRDKESNDAKLRAAETELIASLKKYGAVAKNERGIVLTLPESIWAGPRSSNLMPQADGKLTSLAELLVNHPDYRISVESHTDSSGDPDLIQTVTDRRSYAVADKFASLGVEENRIVAKGFGSTASIAPNTTAANRAKNRRLQVVLVLPQ